MSRELEPASRTVPLILLGPGAVGRALVERLRRDAAGLEARRGLRLAIVAVVDRTAAVLAAPGAPIDAARLRGLCEAKADGRSLAGLFDAAPPDTWQAHRRWPGYAEAPIVVDCSAADTSTALLAARERGWRIALANKLPLTGSTDVFRRLTAGRLAAWEATLASALPLACCMADRVDAGDAPQRIEACLSGTLGFVVEGLDRGERFSSIVREASRRAYVEPDPRADLSGTDSARKGLILARMLGWQLELSDVEIEGLYPSDWDDLSAEDFRSRLPGLDERLGMRAAGARLSGRRLRYVTRLAEGRVHCGLESLGPENALLRSPASDSIAVLHSEVFTRHPLVLSGRGRGPAAAAAAVHADLVRLGAQGR